VREFIRNMLSGDKPESSTRLIAIFLVGNVAGWEWYAILNAPPATKGIVPHIEMILGFIALCLGLKWYNERKSNEVKNNDDTPPAQ
jgi:hypothetical protein